MLRIESSKLFWAHPDSSFLLSNTWLLRGGYAGHTCHDLSFLRYAQNVEIEFDCLHDLLWREDEADAWPRPEDIRKELFKMIWTTLREKCPRVKRVVFNQQIMSWKDKEGTGTVPECLQELIRACPKDVVAEAFIVEKREGRPWNNGTYSDFYDVECRRAHYRPLEGDSWEEVEQISYRNAVLVPGRPFRGPVGDFEKFYFLCVRMSLQERAFWPLVVEALDRHHFDEGRNTTFQCPKAECNVVFTKPGEWTVHAATTAHGWARVEDNLFDILPTELRTVFETKYDQLESKRKRLSEESAKTFSDWNEKGGEKRAEMEQEFLQQLEYDEDWATGQRAVEHDIWKNFKRSMHPAGNRQ